MGRTMTAVALSVTVAATAVLVVAAPTVGAGDEIGFWDPAAPVNAQVYAEGLPVELGLRFRSDVAGSVAGLRFYKPQGEQGTHVGSVWDSGGTLLARATFEGETASGWQAVRFADAVPVTAGRVYTVSYHTTHGTYLSTNDFFTTELRAGPLVAQAGTNGVYAYGAGAFPTQSWRSSNYHVDVLFRPSVGQSPTASPSPVPSPSVSPSPTPGGFPNADNTGVPPGTQLRPMTGGTIRTDGTVLDGVDITGGIDVYANNVTIRNCRIVAGNWWAVNLRDGYTNLTVENCDIHGDGVHQMQYGVKNSGGGWIVVRGNDIHTCSNCVDTSIGLVEDNYVHDPLYFADDHTDMIMAESGPGPGQTLTIRHNTVINTLSQTGAIALFPDFGVVHDVTVENNLMAGGGYTLYGGAKSGAPDTYNIVVRNNVFSRQVWPKGGYWGPVTAFQSGRPGNVWSGNVWQDTGAAVLP